MDIGENKIKLKNVKTGRYLNRPQWSWWSGVETWNFGQGNKWTVHGHIQDSSQITLESNQNDFLYRVTANRISWARDKYVFFFRFCSVFAKIVK